MIPNDIDPSLRTGEPMLESLDDGFSPLVHESPSQPSHEADVATPEEPGLGTKSLF